MKVVRLQYRIIVPAMGTTLEFSDKSSYNQYLEMFSQRGWEFETQITPVE